MYLSSSRHVMKKSRRFSFSRTLRERLRNLARGRWWSSADSNYEKLSESSAATIADEVDRPEYERLEKVVDDRRSLSFIREEITLPGSSQVKSGNATSLPKMATLRVLFGSPLTVFSRLKQSYGSLREAAKLSSLHVGELFVGNQMLMHVSAMPVAGRKKIEAKPSKGFVEPDRTLQLAVTTVSVNTERER